VRSLDGAWGGGVGSVSLGEERIRASMTNRAVLGERVRTLYEQSRPVLLANVLNALIVTVVLWRDGPRPFLAVWCGLMVAMAVVRLELRRRYRRALPGPEQVRRWSVYFVTGSAFAGVLWGAAALVLFDSVGELSQILMTFVVGGMGAAAAGALSWHLPAFWVFLFPALTPLVLRTFAIGDRLHVGMGIIMVVYSIGISIVARITHRAVSEAVRLRFENDALLVRLSHAQQTLEETNRSLERRVVERTEALERQGEVLRHAQRMESVGRLAGGVAHDFNNLLTVVLANASMLLRGSLLRGSTRTAVEEVRGAAERGANLVRQLLAFSRRQKLAPRVLDLNKLVIDMERLLRRIIGDNIILDVTLAPTPAMVRADPGQLEQVIINLATNARDAMFGGGRLAIETSLVSAEGDAALPSGDYVVLEVSDSGVGMDLETRRRAFEPFFTTKEIGQGVGLGLATVYGVVDQSGGRVLVDSQPGKGSSFKVYLPRTRESAQPLAAPELTPGAPAVEATILLAEDEPDVRSATERLLRLGGYHVLAAGDGAEALARSRSFAGTIHLLVTDVVMANMGGMELARRLEQERPGLRVLYISGYSWDQGLPPSDPTRGIDYLEKPLTYDSLMRKVAQVLATPSAPEPPAPPVQATKK
jgi:signal transduction histidine kinase/ActR/RegA family two-component response regulator